MVDRQSMVAACRIAEGRQEACAEEGSAKENGEEESPLTPQARDPTIQE